MSKIEHIVILTGAGISAESEIQTFRDAGGLWDNHPVKQVATPERFAADPKLVHRFYNLRRAALSSVEPNAAHIALGRLQSQFAGQVTLITQNVDDLHERGESSDVIHMHGAQTLELNLEPSQGSGFFSETRNGPATQIVPRWVKSLL